MIDRLVYGVYLLMNFTCFSGPNVKQDLPVLKTYKLTIEKNHEKCKELAIVLKDKHSMFFLGKNQCEATDRRNRRG